MKPALALNLYSKTQLIDKGRKTGTPGTIGENLFKKFLTKENGAPFYGGEAEKPTATGRKNATADAKTRNRYNDKWDETGENVIAMFDFPFLGVEFEPGIRGKLKAYLEFFGLSSMESANLIEAVTDSEGFVRLDRLKARLSALTVGNDVEGMDLYVSAVNVPRLQALLFDMGLSTGEIKVLVEKGNDGDGNLVLGKIWPDLFKSFPEIDSIEKLVRLLSHHEIQCSERDIVHFFEFPELRSTLEVYAATSSEDVRKNIKVILADLLREKGVPPQKVKSFLEGLNVEYAGKVSGSKAGGGENIVSDVEISLLNGITIEHQGQGKREPWMQKIPAILNDSQAGTHKGERGTAPASNTEFSELLQDGNGDSKASSEKVLSILTGKKANSLARRMMESSHSGDKHPFTPGNSVMGLAESSQNLKKLGRMQPGLGIFGNAMTRSQEISTITALLDRMQWMVEAGRQKARIRLSPPQLGQLDLRLVMDQGHIHAHIGTENPLLKEMIESNLGQLRQQLTELGFVVEEFSVYVGQDQQEFSGYTWEGEDHLESTGVKTKSEIEPLSPGLEKHRLLVEDLYQVNVRV